ncbi:MAG: DUF72 domain-containing protein [Chloroflexi bacterium]|nr:DUF72 domain-containing protein [Chloroflexota bacterium]
MMQILVGTSSWADHSLVESGLFYPPEVKTPAGRLRYYSERFPIAEIDSSYHFFPTRQNLALWLDNTPPGFIFDIRAFSLFTGHPTPPGSLPRSIREEHEELANHKGNLYLHHLPSDVADKLWEIFASLVHDVEAAGKLGVVLFQFPPWFHPTKENFDYLIACRQRFPGYRLAVEFRTGGWLSGDNLKETLTFLRRHQLALVCVDEPQGLKTSVPMVAEVTSSVGVVRFHGRNAANWEKKRITAEERFNYLYSKDELRDWLPKIQLMAEQTEKVHVIFKNKSHDFPVRNAREFTEILTGSP